MLSLDGKSSEKNIHRYLKKKTPYMEYNYLSYQVSSGYHQVYSLKLSQCLKLMGKEETTPDGNQVNRGSRIATKL